MLTRKTALGRKIFVQARKYRAPSTECFPKTEHFTSCITVSQSELFLLMKISRIYETVTKSLRFDMAKCKETSKLKTENLFFLKKCLHGPKLIE